MIDGSESDKNYDLIEVLNLSQKSSRSQINDISSEDIPSNVSLALIQQQQRKELEQTSIVRSMLMNACPSNEFDASINVLNEVNGADIQSPERLIRHSPPSRDSMKKRFRSVSKRNHSDSEDMGLQSDSNNQSDESSTLRNNPIMGSPSKLWKSSNDNNVIVCDDQSPNPDPNSQTDGTGLFTCDQCDKTFSKQSSLARHKYEHSGMQTSIQFN